MMGSVREHPAPPGALRHARNTLVSTLVEVREHPAPSGALRRLVDDAGLVVLDLVREHPAPSGAL